MLDLYLILIPAILLVVLGGIWIIRGMSARAKVYGKFVIALAAMTVAGLIAVAFVSSIIGLISLAAICGYLLYKRRPKQ